MSAIGSKVVLSLRFLSRKTSSPSSLRLVSNCAWAVRIVPDELAADRMLALEHVAVSPRSHQLERIDLDRSHSPIPTAVSALADWSEPGEGDKGGDKSGYFNREAAERELTGRGELSPP